MHPPSFSGETGKGQPRGSRSAQVIGSLLEQNPTLRAELGETNLQEILSLSRETDPALFAQGLLVLGARLEAQDRFDAAVQVLSVVQQLGPSDFARQAKSRMQAILGQGAFGGRAEFLLRKFVKDATDFKMIVPMFAGTVVSGLVKGFALGRFAAMGGEAWYTRGLGARLASNAIAFSAEVPAFALAGHLLRQWDAKGVESQLPSFRQELASAALSLGLLKVFQAAGKQTFLGLHRVNPLGAATRLRGMERFNRFAIGQLSTFAGLLAAHRTEEALGLRPRVEGATTITDTVAAMLSLGVGAGLGSQFLGKGFARWNRELALRTEVTERQLASPKRTIRRIADAGIRGRAQELPVLHSAAIFGLAMLPGGDSSSHSLWPLVAGISALMVGGVFSWGRRQLRDFLVERRTPALPPLEVYDARILPQPYRDSANLETVPDFEGSVLSRHENGMPHEVELSGPQLIEGVLARSSLPVKFHPNGRLRSVHLIQDQVIQGIPLQAKQIMPYTIFSDSGPIQLRFLRETYRFPVAFHPNGRLWGGALAAETVLQGMSFPPGTVIHLNSDGQLTYAHLSVPRVLQEIPCDTLWDIFFYPNGRIEKTMISKAHEVEGIPCQSGSWVHFHANGRLARAELGLAHEFAGIRIPQKSAIELDEQGRIRSFSLLEPLVFQGIRVATRRYDFFGEKSPRVWLDEQGKLEALELDQDQVIQNIPCQKETPVLFYKDGHLAEANLALDITQDGVTLPKGSRIQLDGSGRLRGVLLAKPARIQGADRRAGAWLWFDGEGRLEEDEADEADEVELDSPTPGRFRVAAGSAAKDEVVEPPLSPEEEELARWEMEEEERKRSLKR
ncbi:MAG: hypothetical protein U1F66_04020 [bacterium]